MPCRQPAGPTAAPGEPQTHRRVGEVPPRPCAPGVRKYLFSVTLVIWSASASAPAGHSLVVVEALHSGSVSTSCQRWQFASCQRWQFASRHDGCWPVADRCNDLREFFLRLSFATSSFVTPRCVRSTAPVQRGRSDPTIADRGRRRRRVGASRSPTPPASRRVPFAPLAPPRHVAPHRPSSSARPA